MVMTIYILYYIESHYKDIKEYFPQRIYMVTWYLREPDYNNLLSAKSLWFTLIRRLWYIFSG